MTSLQLTGLDSLTGCVDKRLIEAFSLQEDEIEYLDFFTKCMRVQTYALRQREEVKLAISTARRILSVLYLIGCRLNVPQFVWVNRMDSFIHSFIHRPAGIPPHRASLEQCQFSSYPAQEIAPAMRVIGRDAVTLSK